LKSFVSNYDCPKYCYVVDNAGNWTRETTADIKDKSHTHEIETHKKIEILGEEIKRVLQHSIEDIDGKKQIEATAIHLLSTTVANILALGSVNQMAGEYITRSAGKNIIDKATENLEGAAKNIKYQAETNLEQIAAKIHLGTDSDNLLKLVSDFMKVVVDGFTDVAALTVTCTAPGSPSSPPVNLTKFTKAATDIGNVKITLDSMTK
jgi:hypothetical protein